MTNDYSYIFRREHPCRRSARSVWERSRSAYSGGAEYIRQALIKHVSEIDIEYQERLFRAFYINYPRKIARLITQYLLSAEPQRENALPEMVEDFSRTGLRAGEVMRQFSTLLNIYGAAAMIVGMPYFEGELDHERKKHERIRPSVKVLSPLEVIDWAYGDDGLLSWILIEEKTLLDAGPFLPAVPAVRRKLWTRHEFFVFEKDGATGIPSILSRGEHNLGCVPAVFTAEAEGYALNANHYFEDIVRISDAILNNGSEAQMNIVKQLFGLLVISDSFARGAQPEAKTDGDSEHRFSHILARSAAIWETPEERGISRYISPGGTDSAVIREENAMLKRELFDVIGMALRPELHQAQTAEAKAWDHHQVRQFLAERAELLEQCEKKVWELMHLHDPTITVPEIIYNRDFSVTDLKASIESLLNLQTLSDSAAYRKEIGKTALFLLEKIKKISPEQKKVILREMEAVHV